MRILIWLICAFTLAPSHASEELSPAPTLNLLNGSTITYPDIKKQCAQITGIKFYYIYDIFFKTQKIKLNDLMNFCTQVNEKLIHESLQNCATSLQFSCAKKKEEIIKDKKIKEIKKEGIPLGKQGSFILHKKTAPFEGMVEYLSRENEIKNALNLREILKIPKEAPTGKGITIGLYEEGIDIEHNAISACIKKSFKNEQCFLKNLEDEHGTGVGSVLAEIAPDSAIHLVPSESLQPAEDFEALIRNDYPEIAKNCKKQSLDECLSQSQFNDLEEKLAKIRISALGESRILNNSAGFDLKKTKTNYIPDGQFADISKGMPFVFLGLTSEDKKLVVRAAGNEAQPIIEEVKDFTNNNTNNRMIMVGSLAYTDQGEFLDEDSNYTTSLDDIFICAPGQDIIVASPGEHRHTVEKGTSFAAPIVSATLALLMEGYPQWKNNPEVYIKLILVSARKETLDGKSQKERIRNYQTRIGSKCGHGILDIAAAFELAEKWSKNLPPNIIVN
jgi:hypothetical protein